VSSVGENVANLREIVRLIRKHVPRAAIVFTLSPVLLSADGLLHQVPALLLLPRMTSDCLPHQVPLAATFRGVSCVTANAASKAILRVAVDELMREEEQQQQPQQQQPLQQQPPPPPPQPQQPQGGRMGGGGGAGPAGEGAHHPPRPPPNPSPLAAGEGTASSKPEEGEEGEGACAGRVFYWPAYEMVKEGFSEAYLEDGRHPKPEVVCHHLL
jgi:hypothetical protein